jgi:asparagine N-glycosylation enzyme membrane subunit Stt3
MTTARSKIALLLMWLTISALLIIQNRAGITLLQGWDPDDQLRLVQLRDFLDGQSWFDTSQYRLNAPYGTPMHWSRLIELPLVLIVVTLKPLLGQTAAEMAAVTAVPLLLLGGIGYILSRIASVIGTAEAGVIAALTTILSPAILMQVRPMRIDHHAWQTFFAVLALWTMFWPEKKKAGIALGIALAFWLHISLEGAPMAAAFFLLLGWRWTIEEGQGRRLFWAIASFSMSSIALFLATQSHPFSAAIYCDTVSPPHILAIVLAAAVMLPAIIKFPDDRRTRLLAIGLAGVSAGLALLLSAPQCLSGPFGQLNPLVRDYWYVSINEGLPIWHQDISTSLVILTAPLCGLLALWALRKANKGSVRRDLHIAGFFMVYAILMSLLVVRTVSVASAFAVPLTAIWVSQLFILYRRSPVSLHRIGYVAAMMGLLMPGIYSDRLSAAVVSITLSADDIQNSKALAKSEKCTGIKSLRSLQRLPASNIIAPMDISPAILMVTPHKVLASSHHRNVDGMRDQIKLFISPPNGAHVIVASRRIEYIIACPDDAEFALYAKRNPQGLWGQMSKGQIPAWLERIPDMGEGIQLWRVR